MGAYLSEPIVDKISCDEKSDKAKLSFGASSMQGWRVSQEVTYKPKLNVNSRIEMIMANFLFYLGCP
jgi:hypothetical protein